MVQMSNSVILRLDRVVFVCRSNKNITLSLSWNVVPNAGILPLVAGSGQVSLPFPDAYETTKSY